MATPLDSTNPPPSQQRGRPPTIECLWKLLALARVRDWLFSKIVFAVVITQLSGEDLGIGQSLAIATATIALMAFGFGINEIADQSADQAAGKSNRARELSGMLGGVFVAFTAVATVAAALAAKPGSLSAGLAVVYLLIAWQYSCKPLRLKERGLWGIVAAAVAQWTFPIAMVYACGHEAMPSPSLVGFSGLCLSLGIRWEGIHQSADLAADRRTGVSTYAASGGSATKLVLWSYVIELVFAVGTWASLWEVSRVPAVAFAIWCLFFPCLMSIRRMRYREQIMTYETEPLGPFYFRALPVALFLQSIFGWTTLAAAIAGTLLAGLSKLPTQRRDLASPLIGKAGPCERHEAD